MLALFGTHMEYSSPGRIKKVQNRAARFVTGNYNFETGSMTSILEQLGWDPGWESLHKRRKGSKLILLFEGLICRASKP